MQAQGPGKGLPLVSAPPQLPDVHSDLIFQPLTGLQHLLKMFLGQSHLVWGLEVAGMSSLIWGKEDKNVCDWLEA